MKAVLSALESDNAELSILFVDDAEMSGFNKQFLGRTGPTNVLAFPMQEGSGAKLHPHLLGDVVISAQTALAEARQMKLTFSRRVLELLVHGLLHLLGEDHQDPAQTEAMDKKADALVAVGEKAYRKFA